MKSTPSLSFVASVARNAGKYPRPRPGTSERPAFRHPDPLSTALKTELADSQLTFIHRPPPSAPTPYSLSTAPSSPLLAKVQTPPVSRGLPPLSRPAPEKKHTQVADETVLQMRALRHSDPKKYTRSVVAKMFGVEEAFVAFAAGLSHSAAKRSVAERNAVHALHRERWSERHQIVKAIQRKRRTLW